MTAGDQAEKPTYTPGPNAVDITPDKDGGVFKEIIKEGEGEDLPGIGCNVTTHYHGTLLDGTVFDSSKESGKPFEFTLGKGTVIKAWDLGIATMKKGEVCMLTCKPEYAYGKKGSPPKIPGDATLVFEITLLDWALEDISKDNDGGILRSVLANGNGYVSPNDGSLVEVHITGKYQGRVFDDRDVSFNLGEGSEFGIIEGIETALTHFKKEEKSSLEIKPKYAFGQEGHKEFGIPPDATVNYIVELKNFERTKNAWDMDAGEKIAQAKLLKEKATNYFKAGKYQLAINIYNKAEEYVSSDAGFSEEEENTERKSLYVAVKLNLALAYLKLNQNFEAKKECDIVLENDPNNVKGLFRRGQYWKAFLRKNENENTPWGATIRCCFAVAQSLFCQMAYLNMNEPEKAKEDFEAVVRLEPTNKLAANQVVVCCNKYKQQREREKKIYANMFEKFAQKDKEETGVRFGWWDDEKKKPVVEVAEPEEDEDLEEAKRSKKKLLERLKKADKARKEETSRDEEEKKNEGDKKPAE